MVNIYNIKLLIITKQTYTTVINTKLLSITKQTYIMSS